MKVERRAHPRGEKGTRLSVMETARRASEGRLDPRTRAWAIEKLEQAGRPKGAKAQAKVLLDSLRRERGYYPDPTDAEFMPSSACTLKGCEGLLFLGEDCDGLVIAWLAACGSVGIYGAVVGHGYPEDRGQLRHVLAAIWDGSQWHLGDPSTSQPFGTVSAPARERWVAVPGLEVMCDGACAGEMASRAPSMTGRAHGDFVGVGHPSGQLGEQVGTFVGPALRRVMYASIDKATSELNENLALAQQQHDMLEKLAAYSETALTDSSWTPEDEQDYQQTVLVAEKAARYGDEGRTGSREIAWDQQKQDTVVLGASGEQAVSVQGGKPVITQAKTGDVYQPAALQGVILAAIIVVGVAAIAVIASITLNKYMTLKAATQKRLNDIFEKQVSSGIKPSEAAENVRKLAGGLAQVEKGGPGEAVSNITTTITTLGYTALAITVVGVGAYALVRFVPGPRGAAA